MIAILEKPRQTAPAKHDSQFLALIPAIERFARCAFRKLSPQVREEAITTVVMEAFCAFRRLVELGKQDLVYASPLARFAVKRFWAGRCVGMQSRRDVLSQRAKTVHRIAVERLDTFDEKQGNWREALLEDRRATPAEIAAARIDMAAWLRSLSKRNRQIAQNLAMGESTSEAARQFGISRGRVSQLRNELHSSWQVFQGNVSREIPVTT